MAEIGSQLSGASSATTRAQVVDEWKAAQRAGEIAPTHEFAEPAEASASKLTCYWASPECAASTFRRYSPSMRSSWTTPRESSMPARNAPRAHPGAGWDHPSRSAWRSCVLSLNPLPHRASSCLEEGSFELFVEGDDLYESMLADIAAAKQRVWLESFIFAADEVGRRFVSALAERGRVGLDVRVHLDAFGADFPSFEGLRQDLETSSVAFQWFHPFRWLHPFEYRQRNHRKLLVIDDRRAFLGGFNIRRLNSRVLSGETRQRDTHVGVTGGLVAVAATLFDRLWRDEGATPATAIPDDPVAVTEPLLVASDSTACQWRLACLHAALVRSARHHVHVTSPFFGPGTLVEEAMRSSASCGVDVRLLVPRVGDPPVAGWATRAAYDALLESGVRIFEYQPRKLHGKSMAIDAEWAIVGSANLDYMSLFVNQELILLAPDRPLARRMDLQYERDLADAEEVAPEIWRRRGWRARASEAIGYAVRRLV